MSANSSQHELLKEEIKKRSKDGKISCSQARKLSEEFKVSYRLVGALINELKIKIVNCDLGCF